MCFFSILPTNISTCLFAIVFGFFLTNCTPTGRNNSNANMGFLLLLGQTNAPTSFPCPATNQALPSGIAFADRVTSSPLSNPSIPFKNPDLATNGVCGGGEFQGSTDVYTLDSTGTGSSIVLEWTGKKVINTSGIDFVVFENTFRAQGSTLYFIEPTVVEVSIDGTNYCGWNPNFTGASNGNNTSVATTVRRDWQKFAGLTPVLYNMVRNPLTASQIFSQPSPEGYMAVSGGDGFDLSELNEVNSPSTGGGSIGCNATLRNSIQTNGFVFLRLTSATARNLPNPFPSFMGGPDIDGVVANSTATR